MRLIDADAFDERIREGMIEATRVTEDFEDGVFAVLEVLEAQPTIQPITAHWVIDRSGAYSCSKCLEPCATYIIGKPRDKFCKMCGARMEKEK